METLIKFQELIEDQKSKRSLLETILEKHLKKLENHKPAFEVEFKKGNIVYLKLKEKSSIKFFLSSKTEEIINEFNEKYPEVNLKII